MNTPRMITLDGNEAAAMIAHKTNEVIAIYPITPSSPMGELADEWSSKGCPNLWGVVPHVIEMQSEGGAAGTVHGALQAGALTTTFTSSQGLMLMIPNMYKIAGELSPMVMHVAARSLATQALSIFGDHSDVMATRSTGFAMLASNSVQEVMDFALLAQTATLKGRVPILHFFDGFRTSHEVTKVELLEDETLRALLKDEWIYAHRRRALSPDQPVIRGTAQNPDVYFQARETVNPYYKRLPYIVQATMDRFVELTGRRYRLFEYVGARDAERVVILMGSGAEAVEETVDELISWGERVGLMKVRLFRPFSAWHFIEALPTSVRHIAVLDRCKEPGADGEPLYKDVVTALADHVTSPGSRFDTLPRVVGGRYGLASKEFTPAMVKAIFDELTRDRPRNHFTVGIIDDVTHNSLEWDPAFRTSSGDDVMRAVFYGLGSDGTVSANRNTIRIIGEETELYAQGYFVYDSKKAGAVTVSHLRFGPWPIRSTYLIGDNEAQFVGCHQTAFIERFAVLDKVAEGGVFLLNTATPAEEAWDTLPRNLQRQMIEKDLRFYVIDAYAMAREHGMGRRINTIMQICFFVISGVLARDEAIAKIKDAVAHTYGKKGQRIVERNFRAIEATLAKLRQVDVPEDVSSTFDQRPAVPAEAPEFVRRVTGEMIAGRGDTIPVSRLPADGTYPLGTTAYEKRRLTQEIPVWEEDLCIHCGKCPFVCPHTAIRSKVFDPELAREAPSGFKHVPVKGREFEGHLHITYQVAPEDCTGCGLCVEVCPARDKSESKRKALNLKPLAPILELERSRFAFFLQLPEYDRERIRWNTMKGAMLSQPLFEFSSACAGCGETPYIRLATQLFGDRMLIANATGCSSIYGGNLPTTPYTTNREGRGPAWSNSLFEDNAEFGLGFRLALDKQRESAIELVKRLVEPLGHELATALLHADQSDEPGIFEQRERVRRLKDILNGLDSEEARQLETVADALVKKSVWIIGGDGWAYDIGFGGLDHALASGCDLNILVLDTEVYSNTGGQMSKATPRSAVAKFAAGGKPVGKKDLAMIAMAYEHVYVAHVAFGAKDVHTLRAFREAESYEGPSLIIAYSPCIAHGVNLSNNLRQQNLAVNSGHWPLFRYDPRRFANGDNPLTLDSKKPVISFWEFAQTEMRFSVLRKTHPERARHLLQRAQKEIDERYHHYKQLAGLEYENEE
jgi:pyruvate-ferredoxin/flavodoxin oxidoreductase